MRPPHRASVQRQDERLDIKKISAVDPAGAIQLAGVVDQYFAAVFLPDIHKLRRGDLRNSIDIPIGLAQSQAAGDDQDGCAGSGVGNLRGP